jgi:hypothetical protein
VKVPEILHHGYAVCFVTLQLWVGLLFRLKILIRVLQDNSNVGHSFVVELLIMEILGPKTGFSYSTFWFFLVSLGKY